MLAYVSQYFLLQNLVMKYDEMQNLVFSNGANANHALSATPSEIRMLRVSKPPTKILSGSSGQSQKKLN